MIRAVFWCSTLVIATIAVNATARAEIVIGQAGPFSGPVSWGAAELQRGAETAVAHLNAAGGVLGQQVRVIQVDDHCDGEQAVAAAQHLVAQGVDFVLGHSCSGAAIPASKVYAEAGIVMMTDLATNPLLTEQGFANVLRFCGRDDTQGAMAGDYLANRWTNGKIAILHDGQADGEGLAVEVKKALNAQGVTEQLFEVIDPGRVEYVDMVDKLEAADVDALYFAGYAADAALLVREVRERGNDLEFIAGDGVFNEEFRLGAGAAGEGMRFTSYLDAKALPEAADAVAAFPAEGRDPNNQTLLSYAAVQAWAQAVEQAGTLERDAVIEALRSGQFDTVFGRIGFDDKGDVTGYEPFMWYVWQDGDAVPVNVTN